MCGNLGLPKTSLVLGSIIAILALSACSPPAATKVTGSCADRVAVNYSGPSERSYCTTISTYPGGTTVSGTATYTARNVTSNGLSGTTTRPIRFAELEILDASGKRVQCGETAADGTFTNLQVPMGTDALTVRVNSRANNVNELRASVLNCPEENGVYAVEGTFTPSGPQTVNLNAAHDGEVLGGAFNILDQLYDSNEFLRNRVGNCGGAPAAECTPVTTSAPKVKAYWEKGFNPNNYFGSSSPVSFYIPGASRLFILGGEGGDFDNEDTDHFDNSVVIHEYGHFLEDIYTVTNSPGGAHSGNKVIDPRLAWSEGWGDFIQGAVRNDPTYYDTVGSGAASATIPTSTTFAIPMERGTVAYNTYCVGANPSTSGCDKEQTAGEGNFREFSVARILWDIADGGTGNSDSNLDGTSNEFIKVWKAMTASDAFKNSSEEFRSVGGVHEFAEDILMSGTWAALRSTHMHGQTEDYANYVEADASCGTGYLYTMDPETYGSDNGSFATSNLAVNNDFHFYIHSGGTLNLKLFYKTQDTGAAGYTTEKESDLDLFLYNADARYGNATDMKLISQNYFDFDRDTEETEQQSKSLPAGKYLINVKTYTGENTSGTTIGDYAPDEMIDAGSALQYKLTINGVPVCPVTKPWQI